jgi:hypothetical protein
MNDRLLALEGSLRSIGNTNAADRVSAITKRAEPVASSFKESDGVSWAEVARRIYAGSNFLHNDIEYSSDWDCINWSTGGVADFVKANSGKDYIIPGRSFPYKPFQDAMNSPGSIRRKCLKKEEYSVLSEPLSDYSNRSDSFGAGDSFDRNKRNAAAKYILGAIDIGDKYDLFLRLLDKESGSLGSSANSEAGAFGVGQVTNIAVEDVNDLTGLSGFDPRSNDFDNLVYAAWTFKLRLDQYGQDVYKALASYNWGPGNLSRHNSNGGDISCWFGDTKPNFLPKETYDYVIFIMGKKTEGCE